VVEVVVANGSWTQIGLTVARRRTAGVARLNGAPPPGVTNDTGRAVVVVRVVVAVVVVFDVVGGVRVVTDVISVVENNGSVSVDVG